MFLLNFRNLLNHRATVLGVTAALVIVVAWQAGSLVWKLWSISEEQPAAGPLITASDRSIEPELLQNVLRYPLIKSASIPAVEDAAAINAPETTLNLKLVGLLYSTDKDEARAIIVTPADGARSFATRERVADNAEIYSIEPDRVILTHAGRQEALMLDPDQTTASVQPAAVAQPVSENRVSAASPGGLPQTLASGGSKSLDDMMREFSVTPVMEKGVFQGVRLKALKNPKIMEEWGIGPDDVIIAVNGIELNSPGRMMILYDRLKRQREFEVTLDKDGNRRTVAVDLLNEF